MDYEVILTYPAKAQLDHAANYILCDIHFKRHKYFMLYRIEGDKVYVDGIYHDSQDYENIAR